MKKAIGHYDIMIFPLMSVTKPFIQPTIESTPSVQIPALWFHDKTAGFQIRRQDRQNVFTFSCFWQFFTTTTKNSVVSPLFSNHMNVKNGAFICYVC
jgi:hypothetical protein